MSNAANWTCPSCHKAVPTPFCAQCGEEPLLPHDLTLRGLAEKLLHAFTSIDARVLRTALCLLRFPGKLTLAWTAGVRKPYVAPFALFLIANAIFFGVQWLTGANIFSSTLDSHLHHQDWSELATSLVTRRVGAMHTTIELYAPAFDRSAVLIAKSLIVLMTIPFALLLPLVFHRRHAPFMLHVVFSVHLYTFLLLLFCAAMLAAKGSALVGLGGLDSPRVDTVLSIVNVAACAAYLYLAIARVYGAQGAARALQAFVLTAAVAAIVLGYRFAVFLITLYST